MPDHVMNYIECDIPADLTLVQWRRSRVAARPQRRRKLWVLWTPARRPAFAG
jgi:hypothetical protein